MVAVRSVGAAGVEPAAGAADICASAEEDIAGGVLIADVGSVKWIVIRAGPTWSMVRLTLMGTAGL